MTYRLLLPWILPPLSQNDRTHWAAKHRKTTEVRHAVKVKARALNVPLLPAAVVTLNYRPRDNRRRDADNLFATLKPCIDGLRDAGVIVDDDSTRVFPNVQIHRADGPPLLWLTVEPREREEAQ